MRATRAKKTRVAVALPPAAHARPTKVLKPKASPAHVFEFEELERFPDIGVPMDLLMAHINREICVCELWTLHDNNNREQEARAARLAIAACIDDFEEVPDRARFQALFDRMMFLIREESPNIWARCGLGLKQYTGLLLNACSSDGAVLDPDNYGVPKDK